LVAKQFAYWVVGATSVKTAFMSRRCLRIQAYALALAIVWTAAPAMAQSFGNGTGDDSSGSGMGRHQGRRGQSNGQTQQAPALPPLPVVRAPWPRLDSGAILCKSRDDLVSYQKLAAGGAGTGQKPDCRVIEQPLAIQILDRESVARTEVAVTGAAKQTGWTDAYLPSTPSP
jgi:hypothetical protein